MSEIIRALDSNKDWTFGQGLNNYKKNQDALAQDINCNLYLFLNDCWYDTTSGIDWWNLIGSKNQTGLNLAISTTILNVQGVTGIQQINVSLDAARNFSVSYRVQSIYGIVDNIYQYSAGTLGG